MKLYGIIAAFLAVVLYWLKEIFFAKKIDRMDTQVLDLTNTINKLTIEANKQEVTAQTDLEKYETLKKAYDSRPANKPDDNGGGTT